MTQTWPGGGVPGVGPPRPHCLQRTIGLDGMKNAKSGIQIGSRGSSGQVLLGQWGCCFSILPPSFPQQGVIRHLLCGMAVNRRRSPTGAPQTAGLAQGCAFSDGCAWELPR